MESCVRRMRSRMGSYCFTFVLPYFFLAINTSECFGPPPHLLLSRTTICNIRDTVTSGIRSSIISDVTREHDIPHGTDVEDRCARLPQPTRTTRSRRDALSYLTTTTAAIASCIGITTTPLSNPANAYDPDSDPLRESLYLISRVQEATVQQERLVKNAGNQEDLQRKMKLSLRLVDRSYRVLDQITYCSRFIAADDIVEATEAGIGAVDALQEAIDYVGGGLGTGPVTEKQRGLLTEALVTTRTELFRFLRFVPADKLQEARLRVEKENVDNREEFDGDANAGVYNPVVLPWKQQ